MRRYMQNQLTDASAEIFSGLVDIRKRHEKILQKKNPFAYPSSNTIIVNKGAILSLFNEGDWRSFVVDADTELSAKDIDAGSGFAVGADYYVYLVDDGGNGLLTISANATFPVGRNADNSRKIGGFHYGHIRCVNDKYAPVSPNGSAFGTDGVGWQQNVVTGIIPNSVWDLHNRPLCSPEGMALVGNIWVDIYQSSVAEAVNFETGGNGMAFVKDGKLQSKYGAIPATGSEGLNWYSFNELAARSGKRLLTHGEWIRAAYGNPGGQDGADDFGWTKSSNGAISRAGCQVDGSGKYDAQSAIKKFALSAHNLCDTVGNIYEWIDELAVIPDGSWSFLSRDVLGADKGQAYLQNNAGMAALVCGGRWYHGANTGSRTVHLNYSPWNIYSTIGSRLACDKLSI